MKLHNRLKRIEQLINESKQDATFILVWACGATQVQPLVYLSGNIKPGDTVPINMPREWAM